MSAGQARRIPRARDANPFRLRRVALIGLPIVLVLCGAGVGLYLDQRHALNHRNVFGNRTAANRVDLTVTVEKVDPGASTLTLRLLPDPQGNLADAGGGLAKRLEINVIAQNSPDLKFAAGETIDPRTITVALDGSDTVMDYPFDVYESDIGFVLSMGGRPVPTRVEVREVDPFFFTRVKFAEKVEEGVVETLRISRSRGTFILAWFVIVVMWSLAIAVMGGTYVLIRRRLGMIWPALGWMAATLFALVGLRNAAPGSPPIGSLIDYVSFFWAEAIVALSLVSTVAFGVRTEYEDHLLAEPAAEPEAGASPPGRGRENPGRPAPGPEDGHDESITDP